MINLWLVTLEGHLGSDLGWESGIRVWWWGRNDHWKSIYKQTTKQRNDWLMIKIWKTKLRKHILSHSPTNSLLQTITDHISSSTISSYHLPSHDQLSVSQSTILIEILIILLLYINHLIFWWDRSWDGRLWDENIYHIISHINHIYIF